jgi:hypothetical protein
VFKENGSEVQQKVQSKEPRKDPTMRRCDPLSLIRRCLALFALCAFPFSIVFTQSATTTLSGTVTDPNGAAVIGAHVTVTNNSTGLKRQATTNDSGAFTIQLLPPSVYTVLVENQGFTPAEIKDVTLNVGDNVGLNIQMKIGQVGATVDVRSDALLINESPSVSTVIDRNFVENMPLNGRSFQSLIALAPGIVGVPAAVVAGNAVAPNSTGQFSVNGQRASGNAFMVDGVSANFGASPNSIPSSQSSGNLPGLTASGTTQSLASIDSMQEFKIQTSTYSAEFGRQPGGQISIVTRSGTNQFHGSLFDYLRNDVFDANDWFANANGAPKPPQRQNDFGGTFSGPVILPRFGEGGHQPGFNGRDRTFFFFSYEGLRLRQPTFALTNVPTMTLRQQAPASVAPILNAFPVPNGRDLGNGLAEFTASYSNPSSIDAVSLRIDHTINSKFTAFGRYNQAPSESATRSTGNLNLTGFTRLDTKTITLGLVALFTPQLSNDLRANYSDNFAFSAVRQGNFAGAVPLSRNILVPAQYDSSSAQGVAVLFFPGRTSVMRPLVDFVDRNVGSQRQFNVVDTVSYSVGSHLLKLGVDYRRLTPIYVVNTYLTEADFGTAQDVLNARAGFGFSIQASVPVRPTFVNISAFGHDTWKVSRRLTLDLGLRWDVNPAPGEANGNLPLAVTQVTNLPTMQLASRGTALWSTTYKNFAPRLGGAYQLAQNPGRETVLRAGFGVFFDTGNDQGARPFSGFPFSASTFLPSLDFPIVPSQVAPPTPPALQATINPPYGTISGFDPNLKLPYTLQWSAALEQFLGPNHVFTLSYVAASGRRLLQLRRLALGSINPSFRTFNLTTNVATSDYNSLQAQVQRRMSHGLQALFSYTWSHAIDEDSQSVTQRVAQRGNADFDIRHNFAAALTYDVPFSTKPALAHAVLSGWAVDATVHARSALPTDIIATAIIDPATGDAINIRPNVLEGVPLYLNDPTVPGGRKINRAAFLIPAPGQLGNLGRNVLRGLPAWQIDFALRRQFHLTEKLNLQVRAEAFNILNHPNFGTIQTTLSAPNFGQATNMLSSQLGGISPIYQLGGPRSLQLAMKLQF